MSLGTYYVAGVPYSDELYHHGIKGQKWGIRRFQNPDGSLTEAGKKHYFGTTKADVSGGWAPTKATEKFNKITDKEFARAYRQSAKKTRYNGEGRPSSFDAANKTTARKLVVQNERLKESKKNLYKTLEPELEFESNHKLWKKFGYDPDNKDFKTVHDAENSYYDAKEKYMESRGLKRGTDARKKYEDDRSFAFMSYNSDVRYAVNDLLGRNGSVPVTVISKYKKVYYDTARDAIARSLQYGRYADGTMSNYGYGNGNLDFWYLADEYAKEKGYK